MPRCLEPGQSFSVYLDSDADKSPETRPTFSFRALSCREWRAHRVAMNAATGWGLSDHGMDLLKSALLGWTNMNDPKTGEPIPFDANELDAVLDQDREIFELLNKMSLGAGDKKKLESPTSSSPASSVVDAAQAGA